MNRNLRKQNFISSFDFDKRLAPYDIAGALAHVKMLSKCRIISDGDAKKIIKGLGAIADDLKRGKSLPSAEDVHYAVEKELIKRIGVVGGKMHAARSRNDQVATDLKLYLKDEIKNIVSSLLSVQRAILKVARNNIDAIMPGYTHLKQAQPILFSHHMMAYFQMFERDIKRFKNCYDNLDESPLGSAALAGTSFPIDRGISAKLMGFARVSENSIDSVSDRDFATEFIASAAILMLHTSRLAEDLIIWSSDEFDFVKIAAQFTSGSSIMPQKRNPDFLEIIRGKTGRIYGNLTSILTILKGLPLSYNRDLQEAQIPLFDTADTLKDVLAVLSEIISSLKLNHEKMEEAFKNDYILATEVADYLTKKGLPFRTAHGITKKIVEHAIKNKKNLSELKLSEYKKFSGYFKSDIHNRLNIKNVIESKKSLGGTSRLSVGKQIAKAKT